VEQINNKDNNEEVKVEIFSKENVQKKEEKLNNNEDKGEKIISQKNKENFQKNEEKLTQETKENTLNNNLEKKKIQV